MATVLNNLGAAIPQAPQSRLSAYCTSMASHAGDCATIEDCLHRILTHLTGNAGATGEAAGKTGPAPVTGLLDDAENWLAKASGHLHNARELAERIETLVTK